MGDVNDDDNDDDDDEDDDDDDAVQSLLSGSTNLCDECAVSRSRQPICLPPSAPPSLLVSIGYPLFQWTPFVSMDCILPPFLQCFCH